MYVALTRAKEKLILVSAVRNAAGFVKKLLPGASCPAAPEAVGSCTSMAQWILLPLLCRTEAFPLRQAAGLESACICNDGSPWHVEWVDGHALSEARPSPESGACGGGGGAAPLTGRCWNSAIPMKRKRAFLPS